MIFVHIFFFFIGVCFDWCKIIKAVLARSRSAGQILRASRRAWTSSRTRLTTVRGSDHEDASHMDGLRIMKMLIKLVIFVYLCNLSLSLSLSLIALTISVTIFDPTISFGGVKFNYFMFYISLVSSKHRYKSSHNKIPLPLSLSLSLSHTQKWILSN